MMHEVVLSRYLVTCETRSAVEYACNTIKTYPAKIWQVG